MNAALEPFGHTLAAIFVSREAETLTMTSRGAQPASDHDPDLKLRSYQQEMLEASLKKNVIVVVSIARSRSCREPLN